MTPDGTRRAAGCGRASPATLLTHSLSPHLPLESSTSRCQGIYGDVLVDVHRLCVLSQVIETGETARTMTLEWSLAGVFPGMVSKRSSSVGTSEGLPNVPGQMFASSKTQVARRVIRAIKSLRLLLLVGSGTIGIHAVVVGSLFTFAVGLVHVHILRVP